MKMHTLLNEKTNRKLGYRIEGSSRSIDFTNTLAKECGFNLKVFTLEKKISAEEFKQPSNWQRTVPTNAEELKKELDFLKQIIDNEADYNRYKELLKIKEKSEKVKTSKKLVYKGGLSVILLSEESSHGEYHTLDSSVTAYFIFKTKKAIADFCKLAKDAGRYGGAIDKNQMTERFEKGNKVFQLNLDARLFWHTVHSICDSHWGIFKNGFSCFDRNEYSDTRVDKHIQYPFQAFPNDAGTYLGTTADSESLEDYINGIRKGINEGKIHFYPELYEGNVSSHL